MFCAFFMHGVKRITMIHTRDTKGWDVVERLHGSPLESIELSE